MMTERVLPSPGPSRDLRTWLANLIENHAVLGEGPWEAADRILESGRLVDREAIDIEAVAAVEHDQWAHWTAYMLDNLTEVNIARWRQQIECPYPALTETEKDSDREWANKAVAAALGGSDG